MLITSFSLTQLGEHFGAVHASTGVSDAARQALKAITGAGISPIDCALTRDTAEKEMTHTLLRIAIALEAASAYSVNHMHGAPASESAKMGLPDYAVDAWSASSQQQSQNPPGIHKLNSTSGFSAHTQSSVRMETDVFRSVAAKSMVAWLLGEQVAHRCRGPENDSSVSQASAR